MLPALWPIQRAQPRPCTYPYALVDPPKRLTSPMPFMQQIRPHARAITSTHKQTYMHATTPPGTHTNVHTDTTRKHTDAQTRTHRKTRRRTNATHATHTPTHMRTDTNDTTGGHNKCQRTHTSMHKHDMHSNTPAQHLKFRSQTPHRHHTQTRTDTPMRGGGGGLSLWLDARGHACAFVCVCVCVCFCLHVVVPHTQTRPHEKNTFAWGLALGTLLLQGVSAGRPVAGKIPANRKPAGALFWHLNWSDRPKVYIKGRVRPEKKNTPIKAVRCRFGPPYFRPRLDIK